MDPADAVLEICRANKIGMDKGVAKAIVDAIYAAHETTVGRRHIMPRMAWEDRGYRDGYLAHMRSGLIDEAISNGWLPATLPETDVTFTQHMFPRVVSERKWEEADEAWDNAEIRMRLKVRRALPAAEYILQPKQE